MRSHKGFRYAMISLVLSTVVLAGSTLSIAYDLYILSLAIGLITFLIGMISIIGFVFSLKGIKEKNTVKKWIGLVINTAFLLGFVFVIIANIIDIYKAFS
ncbi:MAG: hypothetical protein AAFX55_09605 [Bacteroidota bacterium]